MQQLSSMLLNGTVKITNLFAPANDAVIDPVRLEMWMPFMSNSKVSITKFAHSNWP